MERISTDRIKQKPLTQAKSQILATIYKIRKSAPSYFICFSSLPRSGTAISLFFEYTCFCLMTFAFVVAFIRHLFLHINKWLLLNSSGVCTKIIFSVSSLITILFNIKFNLSHRHLLFHSLLYLLSHHLTDRSYLVFMLNNISHTTLLQRMS